MIRASWLPLLALVLAFAGHASADEQDEAASTELFNAGRDLMRRGDYAAACPKLADSARLKPTVGALAKLAECEEHEKRVVSAYTRWKQALNLARSLSDERVADVERQVVRLDRVVAKIRVLAAGPLPSDTVIRVDDLTLSTAGLGVLLPVEPGRHTVQATAPHAKTWSAEVETAPDGATTSVTVPALESADEPSAPQPIAAPAPSAPPLPTEAAPAPRSGAWRTAGVMAAAAGLGLVAAGGAFGFVALHRRDGAHCAGTVCPDIASASALQSAKTSADWSTALFVAGGALVASGVAVWVLARDSHGAVRVGAAPMPGGAAFIGTW